MKVYFCCIKLNYNMSWEWVITSHFQIVDCICMKMLQKLKNIIYILRIFSHLKITS